ncbi:LysR family transcriptional regulator [Pseudothauera lacus]|uniref:LysR family transcriptional regulator n=1 Tax=Pseudothauera lacus TaxID=2136175 RepID=A0A2T4IER9_9RHOO|nr:LysR family transcriptional regulator [Pseudothauera lacus]PTD96258.1 LysR family transcriptional regulator [Pseudothauera lacus]
MPATPDIRFPSIDGLRAFEAATRLGSFERAADELHVTASAVSKRVATVEELLGASLLSRGGKALTPTALGKEYLEQVRAALALLAAVPLHQRAAQRVERLRVCAPPTFARQVLVPALASFARAQPQIELEIVLSVPYLDLGAADAELEVRHGDVAAHGGEVLMNDVVVPLAAPALVAGMDTRGSPATLAGLPLLRSPLEPWAALFAAAGLAGREEPASGPRLVDLGLLLEAAASAQGVAPGRPTLARPWLRSGALVPLFGLQAAARTQYYIAHAAPQGAAAVFTAWLREVCRAAEAEAAELLSRHG